MKVTTTRSRSIIANDRIDARFFTAPGAGVTEQLAVLGASGVEVRSLGSLADVWDPPRFARVYAFPGEPGLPYLRPYDVFDFLPTAADRLSLSRNDGLEALVPAAGTILQTCSGRNLGPCAMADSTVDKFALSHDMIRIQIDDPSTRYYVYAFLKTSLGQKLLRRGMSGSVIDHLTTADVRSIQIPMLPSGVQAAVARLTATAFDCLSEARHQLGRILERQQEVLPVPRRLKPLRDGWQVPAARLGDRIDAAFHDPLVAASRKQLITAGSTSLGELATASLPARYKRYYVEGKNGRPILSGRQLLQAEPVNLRRVSDRSFADPALYELASGITLFGAVGRAEGRQGAAALVTPDRAGWLASNDVMRLTPKEGVSPGAVWLAIACAQVRMQINALSFGSVIDHMNPWDVERVTVPVITDAAGEEAQRAWFLFGEASCAQQEATLLLESHFSMI